MDPNIALQFFLTLAKICGTVLAIFMAIIVFALKDEDLARLLLQKEPGGYAPLLTLLLGCTTLITLMLGALFEIVQTNWGELYDVSSLMTYLAGFSIALVFVFFTFVMLLWEKRDFLKKHL